MIRVSNHIILLFRERICELYIMLQPHEKQVHQNKNQHYCVIEHVSFYQVCEIYTVREGALGEKLWRWQERVGSR